MNYDTENENSDRINATILSLVRNEELEGILDSMNDLERTWNRKFNYPWTFFNDVPFTAEFKQKTTAATNAKTHYCAFLVSDPPFRPNSLFRLFA
jgi:mannosyltransferase